MTIFCHPQSGSYLYFYPSQVRLESDGNRIRWVETPLAVATPGFTRLVIGRSCDSDAVVLHL